MHVVHAGLAAIAGAAAGFVAAAWLLQPVILPAQAAIINEYLAVYCHAAKPTTDERKLFMSGQAAALSRVTVAAGLGELALLEYAKCKL